MTIGEQIQNLRINKGMTQEDLAEKLNVSRQSVSKWELGQAIPDIDKVIKLSKIFNVSSDKILLIEKQDEIEIDNSLKLMNTCIITKKFEKIVEFYKKFLRIDFLNDCNCNDKVAYFYVDGKCIVIMNEDNIDGVEVNYGNSFIQNYWAHDLVREHKRVKGLLDELNLPWITEIKDIYPNYHYFRFTDPDNNIIEINGGLNVNIEMCQSCGMPLSKGNMGNNNDGTECKDYCKYCYQDGRFTKEMTMEQMAEYNLNFLDDYNKHSETKMTKEELREYMMKMLPGLKRWKSIQ